MSNHAHWVNDIPSRRSPRTTAPRKIAGEAGGTPNQVVDESLSATDLDLTPEQRAVLDDAR